MRGSKLPGEPVPGSVVVFDDVTELSEAQRGAAWAEVARRLAHEIKNPLTPIQLSAERLAAKLSGKLSAADEDMLLRGTHTIVAQVTAMKQMVDDFAIYARQPRPGRMQPVDLGALLLDVLGLYENLRPSMSLTITADNAVIQGEPTRLRQVIHNLIQNAVDAQADAPEPAYDIGIEVRGEELALSVGDRGAGFPADILAHAFEPYVTTKSKGTGLGLAIVKKIVDEHQGRVAIENRQPHGAMLTLYFPREGTSK
jgi:nitrogen fixation/metabolism regulation signal transduction histidine kinase